MNEPDIRDRPGYGDARLPPSKVMLLDCSETSSGKEMIEALVRLPGLRIERILSLNSASPPGFWYEQEDYEWVLVLSGWGDVEFEDGKLVRLLPGEALNIPPGCRHRVAGTDPDVATVWLAVHAAVD